MIFIHFFLKDEPGCIRIWTNCQVLPDVGHHVRLPDYGKLKVFDVTWVLNNVVEVTLE